MKYQKIGDVCTILSGYAFDSKQFTNDPQDVPLIRIRDIVRGRTATYTKEKFDEKYIVKRGDLLIGMDGEFNIAPWNSRDALLNQRVCKIWCTSDEIEDKYLFYFLPKALKDIESKTSFVTVKHLSVKSINQIEIPLPPIEIQQKIAKTLDTAADLLKLRKQQLAELDQLIQSVFYEMFGDPVRNEKGWETGVIRDVVTDVKYGTSKPAVEGGKYTYLRMNNITYEGHLDLTSLKYIDMPDKEVEKYIVRRGDVLFNRTNSKELVGKTCVFNQDKEMIIAGYIIRLRVNERVLPEYLSAVLNSQYGKSTLFGMCKAIIGQANINAQELQKIELAIPPIELQKEYVKIVNQVAELKLDIKKSLEETRTLFNGLMQKYFD